MIGYIKIGAAVAAVVALLWAARTVNGWREAAAELPEVRAEFTAYRDAIARQADERARRERVNQEVEQGYVETIRQQEDALRSARDQLSSVRLRVGTCPALPAADRTGETPAAPAPESAGELAPDAAADLGDLAARCDRVAAQLNALIDWHARQ